MNQQTYTTKEIADAVGVHVNTVRFYEEIGFLTKPKRSPNGYRVYTRLHLAQCGLIRRAMRAEVLQNGLRAQAVRIVRLCAALDFGAATAAGKEYCRMLRRETRNAKAAITAAESVLSRKHFAKRPPLTRREAAEALRVTPETIRTWERSGLLKEARFQGAYRVYDAEDMERLNIVRTLRCANYSLSAILRLVSGLDQQEKRSVGTMLNTPGADEEILSACDRLILSLESTATDAEALFPMIEEIKVISESLQ